MFQRVRHALLVLILGAAMGAASASAGDRDAGGTALRPAPKAESWSIQQVVASAGDAALQRLQPKLASAGFPYAPPNQLMLLAFKQERKLEIWGRGVGRWHRIAIYPILAASGRPGPKLVEGDRQVPEGIYPISALNAASNYHLAPEGRLSQHGGPAAGHARWAHGPGRQHHDPRQRGLGRLPGHGRSGDRGNLRPGRRASARTTRKS